MINKILPDLTKRAIGLDLLRALAILMVLFYHGWIFVSCFFPKAGMLFFLGYWGVELFFVLSGFLIGGILIEKVLNTDSFGFSSILDFWKRRWIRTIPIYLIALLLHFISINYIVGFPTTFDFRYLFFAQNLVHAHPSFFPEAWSLSVEEWFYLSLPLAVFVALVLPTKNKENRLLMAFMGLLLLFTLFRWSQSNGTFDINSWDKNIRKVVAFRLDALLYGVIAAWVLKTQKSFAITYRKHLFLLGAILVPVAYFVFYKKYSAGFNNVFFSSLSSMGFALTLFYFKTWQGPKNKSIINAITFLSVISYSLYLIHYTFLFRVLNNFIVARTLINASVLLFVYLLLAIVLASFFHCYFEKPFLKLKEKMKA
ncbi:MAG: hypothetical protein RI934_823 [Bacteroidota bacterium]